MKILFLTNQLNIGGVEKNIVRLTEELVGRGHEVVAATAGGDLAEEMIRAGGRHVTLSMSLNPAFLLRNSAALSKLVHLERPDVVHIFSASSAIVWWVAQKQRLLASHKVSPPAVSSIMGLQNSPEERPLVTKARAFAHYLGVQKMIIMAPAIGDLVKKLPVDPKRLEYLSVVGVTVPESLEEKPKVRSAARSRLGVSERQPMILTIGNLEPRKSHELFVSAASLVNTQRPDARFYIVGEGERRPLLEEQIKQAGLAEQVHLLGARHDVEQLLCACDVYVRPGIVEGFIGITVLEAQALAVPVISFELEDVKLAVEDGETGRLVPPADTNRLALSILEFLEDQDLASEIAEKGREQVLSKFSMASITDQVVGIYEGVMGSKDYG